MGSTPQELQASLKSSFVLPDSGFSSLSLDPSSLSRDDAGTSRLQFDQGNENFGLEGCGGLAAVVQSQRSVQDYLQDLTVENGDSHLVEFSEALQTVAKTLRQVAESKARAQEETAEWKRKYVLELLRQSQFGQILYKQGRLDQSSLNEIQVPIAAECTNQLEPGLFNEAHALQNGNGICSQDGICSRQVIQQQRPSSDVEPEKATQQKASFRLEWGLNGNTRGRHKHDIVSYDCGQIAAAARSSKQITLVWDTPPLSVLIILKPNSSKVATVSKAMARWLWDENGVTVFVENNVRRSFIEDNSDLSFVQACETDDKIMDLHKKVDLVITLGGDGTVLWAASLFKGPVPPLVSFSMGSLGFMTPFQTDRYKDFLTAVLKGPLLITLRQRLQCRIIRNEGNLDCADLESYLVLNEISIDRGMTSYLTNLECYCDNVFMTCVQGDGLILSTPSGSTAYSLAAGGSVVHCQVPSILFTPICPHSLSFRPLILPEHVTLRVQLPVNSRGQAWVSFDGKDRQKLSAGDALIVSMSAWPVPAVCDEESTKDFLRSVRDGLHWNLRKSQSFDGPSRHDT